MGVRREIEILAERATLSLQTERRASQPWGLNGGGAGARGRNALVRAGVEQDLPDKCTVEVARGDIVIVETPGGGGYG
jgi:N-methylhydantoinase B/oxoprolinase/acetone carboxylase alpha subunit